MSETKDDKHKLLSDLEDAKREIEKLKAELASKNEDSEASEREKGEFKQMVTLVKQELKERYTKQFLLLKDNATALKDNFTF